MRACGDRDLVLARQVGVLAIAVEESRRLGDERRHVEKLVVVDARDRASRDIAHDVAASAHRGEPDALELLENLRKLVERDVVKLDVLARGQLALVAAVGLGDFTDRAEPLGAEDAAGDFDAHHERADFRLVVIHPEPLQAARCLPRGVFRTRSRPAGPIGRSVRWGTDSRLRRSTELRFKTISHDCGSRFGTDQTLLQS